MGSPRGDTTPAGSWATVWAAQKCWGVQPIPTRLAVQGSPHTPVIRPTLRLLVASDWLLVKGGLGDPSSGFFCTKHNSRRTASSSYKSSLSLEMGASSHETRKVGPPPPLPAQKVPSFGGKSGAPHLKITSSQLTVWAHLRNITVITCQQRWANPTLATALICTGDPLGGHSSPRRPAF